MKVKVRIPQKLLQDVRNDLLRPHAFAAERVGFLYGRLVSGRSLQVLMTEYEPLADDRYVRDPHSGARIDSQAIRGGMQGVLDKHQGAFHVHMHYWPGHPKMSRMDAEEIPRVITAFQRVGSQHAHGIFLLHDVECATWVWLPGANDAVQADAIAVVGFPLQIFRGAV